MSTVIYSSPIFGPIHSRRLGLSLGINLMPADGKLCSFDCIYCECGFNAQRRPHSPRPTREQVKVAMENQLKKMQEEGRMPDVLTFAGNGEPTMHPHFLEIVEDSIVLRNKYCPKAKVSVLSNATMILKDSVFRALQLVDNNILKLDTANTEYIRHVDRPNTHYDLPALVQRMKDFHGHIIIQTMFMHGEYEGKDVSNLSEEYVGPWLKAVEEIAPQQVMVYTIDRETPDHDLRKALPQELDTIADRLRALGIPTSVAY